MVQTGIWKNPDITREDYCRLLGTNHQYLAMAVKTLGYENLPEMLNSYRLESLSQMIDKHPQSNIQDLIFEVGFRNMSTANRVFQQKYGCTITSYRKNRGGKIGDR